MHFQGNLTKLRFRKLIKSKNYRASNIEQAVIPLNTIAYDIRTNLQELITYFDTIQTLKIIVYETALRQKVGQITIPINNLIDRNSETFLECVQKYQITDPTNSNEVVGQVQISLMGSMNSDQENRIANSMVTQEKVKPYTSGKYKSDIDYMSKVEEMKNKLKSTEERAKTIRALPSMTQKKIMEKTEEKPSNNNIIDKLLEKGKELNKKMANSLRDNAEVYGRDERVWRILHGETQEKQMVLPYLKQDDIDLDLNDEPEILKEVATEDKEKEMKKKEIEAQPQFNNLKDFHEMKVTIVGISIKSEEMRNKLKGHSIFLNIKIPTAEYGSNKATQEEMKTQLILDNQGKLNIFDVKKSHECGLHVSDENFSSLVNSNFSIELITKLNDEKKFQTFGKGELSFQKILLSQDFKKDTLVRLVHVAPKQDSPSKIPTSKSKMQSIPKNKLKKIEPITDVAEVRIIIELKTGSIQKRAISEPKPVDVERNVMIGLLLGIKIGKAKDVVLRKYQNDQTEIFRNLYVKYKSYPTAESISTKIVWGSNSPSFNHSMQYPLFLNPEQINKLQSVIIVFELWDKHTTDNIQGDELIGLTKVSLWSFHESLKAHVVPNCYTSYHILNNAYPFILADDFLPVINTKLGQTVGYLKITAAIGTPAQVIH